MKTDRGTDVSAHEASDPLKRASSELMRRCRAGLGPTPATTQYRQVELAELLRATAGALDRGQPLPDDLVRHATNLARHILSYPPVPIEPPAR